ncbi:sugar phosphate isomerase/epimerase family protein [Desulfonema magnum]|uniref:Xylose isormerase domain-containing protein, TIM barrel n=1 Tax=Desulfonema magnum TaxID=45655 RepID=A0A975GL22_9BACT|nr:sugar phosphate isomerase/epimerase family protein [Desulfonema magnum]QTA85332.1 Xylose isormerase domain-containing protein, TIM barrel [Desulfonema magnum]
MQHIIEKVHVSIRFTKLRNSYIDTFVRHRINPEIAFDGPALDRYSLSDFVAIAKQLHENSLSVTFHAPFMDISPGSPDPAIREVTWHRFEQMLRLVPVFKPKTVVSHAGYDRKRYHFIRDEWVENSLKIWKKLAERIRDEGGRLMLENVYEHGPEDIRIFFENLEDQKAGFCLDIGHQTIFSKTSLELWLESLGPYLGQLHLHDNFGKKDDHLGLGKGSINFEPLFSYLKNRKKTMPVITLEPHQSEGMWDSFKYLEKVCLW